MTNTEVGGSAISVSGAFLIFGSFCAECNWFYLAWAFWIAAFSSFIMGLVIAWGWRR